MDTPELFSDSYLRMCDTARVGEGPAAPEPARMPVRERLVRCFWFDQNFSTDDLRTADGRKLRVLSPGWWNLEAGPDFRNAVIRIANEPILKGDIELHVDAADWYAHGHHADAAYESVILHVALRGGPDAAVRTASGRLVPQFFLEPYLPGGLGELSETVNPEDYPEAADCSTGPCNAAIRAKAVDDAWLGLFFDYAGDQRAQGKMQRWEQLVDSLGPEAAIEGAVMEALGFKKNKSQFALLARLAPPDRLRAALAGRPAPERQLCAEAVLFGLSGLLDLARQPGNGGAEPAPDTAPEVAAYLADLDARWRELAGSFPSDRMDGRQWQFGGSRPVNFPTRRIAAAAAFLARHLDGGLLRALLACLPPETGRLRPRDIAAARRSLQELFTGLESAFWQTRWTFAGKPMARAAGLVGADRAQLIIVNVVIPVLLLHARRGDDAGLENLLHGIYVKLPRLAPTSVEEFMALRIFGGSEQAAGVIRNARRQQGLLQVFKDYCEKDDRGCRRCGFLAALENRR